MKLLELQYKIIDYMSQFYVQVNGATHMGLTDFNKVSETILIPLFSEVFSLNHLRNLNAEIANFPGIDLGDDIARVAFQITATADSGKIKDTLQKFCKYEQYQKYDRLIVYILTEKQSTYSGKSFQEIIDGKFSFDPQSDVLDYKDILFFIKDYQVDRSQKILEILERNFDRGGVVLFNEIEEDRKEVLYLNLIEFSFPNELFIAQVDEDIRHSIKKRKDKRKALISFLDARGLKFSVDWEIYEGKIISFHNLRDTDLPITEVIDAGSVEVFSPEDFFEINENYLRVFKSLLRRCLQQKLYKRHVLWQNTDRTFIFSDINGEKIRKEHWRGKVSSDRIVFEKTMKSNKPNEILKCKHLSFKTEIKIINKVWYLQVKPDWFFSYDGYRKSAYCDKDIDWLKRNEKNANVFNHLRFINYFLKDETVGFFDNKEYYPFLNFLTLKKFEGASFLDDSEWLPNQTFDEDGSDENLKQLNLLGDI